MSECYLVVEPLRGIVTYSAFDFLLNTFGPSPPIEVGIVFIGITSANLFNVSIPDPTYE